jgi:hypothetical protein
LGTATQSRALNNGSANFALKNNPLHGSTLVCLPLLGNRDGQRPETTAGFVYSPQLGPRPRFVRLISFFSLHVDRQHAENLCREPKGPIFQTADDHDRQRPHDHC